MDELTLQVLTDKNLLPKDNTFKTLLIEASEIPKSFLSVMNLVDRKFDYISPRCKSVTGYEPHDFINGGLEFMFSITLTTSVPGIVNAQKHYMTQAKISGFNPTSAIVHEYPFEIRTASGSQKQLISLGMILTYTESADFQCGAAIVAENNSKVLHDCRSKLLSIKERHNELHEHIPFSNLEALQKNSANQVNQILTSREEEILKLIANGFTSIQIAKQLLIEENTVETHRKNILAKFNAKNIAELIKKASKIYWLK